MSQCIVNNKELGMLSGFPDPCLWAKRCLSLLFIAGVHLIGHTPESDGWGGVDGGIDWWMWWKESLKCLPATKDDWVTTMTG